ncbi:MAG: S46 family peptidase [Odoribacter sp.]
MMKKLMFLILSFIISWTGCIADEGMWIPMLLKKYNIEEMQKQGFKLTAEDIYAINRASLKDAVIGLGKAGRPFSHFCTGNLVSSEGLVVTNHHCSFDMIQSHSSLEHNYLKDGFWAKNKQEELANPGITASILVRMEDVTDQIHSQLTKEMTASERSKKIAEICKALEEKAMKGSDLMANIKPYFNGNQYFMSVFRIYKDVRLVGAPASAIGKFGGDTDNWMWPRHTGDFSVLRIYANANNEPADYSPANKPYKPDSFFKISTKGVKEGDFTMVFGYPGTTNEYLTSYAVEQIQQIENPHKIAIRTAKLNVMNDAMESDELLRIKYAAKAASVANAWKKWQGETKGLERFNTVANKQKLEEKFQNWATEKQEYNTLLDRYKQLYNERKDLILASSYLNEAGKKGAEIISWEASVYKWMKQADFVSNKEALKNMADEFYKDYDAATDRKILIEMLKLYNENLPKEWIPLEVQAAMQKKGVEAYAMSIFNKSIFANQEKLTDFINRSDAESYKKLEKDPAYLLAVSMDQLFSDKIYPELSLIEKEITVLNETWLKGLMEMQPQKTFYADANSTLRIAYGKVEGYSPCNAVRYKHYTTLNGIMEKDNPKIYDYDVPQILRDIYKNKDFGPYTQEGNIPVCFIATNHTTGGNSGSPVLNAEGHLIGLNFDRAWDGVMSDIEYNPEICRNISVDIRYVLFVIDKVAGAGHLIQEMEIVKD